MNRKKAPRLSLDLLRGFRSAARHLSFTRAAQDLFVTQSAISREIKTLEEQLDKLHPIKTPADLAHHVRLDYESMRDGRRLSLWDFWFDKTKIPHVKPASTLQFPQYDQLVSAAIDGAGVGIAVLPHTAQHLQQKALCVPFGLEAVALLGAFYIIRRRDVAGRDAVEAFVDWLRSEVKRDAGLAPASVTARGGARTSARKSRSTSTRRNA